MTVEEINNVLFDNKLFNKVEMIGKERISITTGCVYDNKSDIVLEVAHIGGALALTDNGRTRAFLDEVFELTEPDVVRNILNVSDYYGISTKGKQLSIHIGEKGNEFIQGYLKMMYCIGFLNDMSIFFE